MPSPASTMARLVRTLLVGVWVTLGATLGHLAGDGSTPPLAALIPVVSGVASVAWWATRRRLAFSSLVGLLTVPQVAVHLLTDYVHGHLMVPSVSMLAAHAASTVVTAAVIAHGERLWWSLWESWSAHWRVLAVPAPLVALRPPVMVVAESSASAVPLRHVVTRRGPHAS